MNKSCGCSGGTSPASRSTAPTEATRRGHGSRCMCAGCQRPRVASTSGALTQLLAGTWRDRTMANSFFAGSARGSLETDGRPDRTAYWWGRPPLPDMPRCTTEARSQFHEMRFDEWNVMAAEGPQAARFERIDRAEERENNFFRSGRTLYSYDPSGGAFTAEGVSSTDVLRSQRPIRTTPPAPRGHQPGHPPLAPNPPFVFPDAVVNCSAGAGTSPMPPYALLGVDWTAYPEAQTAVRTMFRQVFRAWEALMWLRQQRPRVREAWWNMSSTEVFWGPGSGRAAAYPEVWLGSYSDRLLDETLEFFSSLGDLLSRTPAPPGSFGGPMGAGVPGIRIRKNEFSTICLSSNVAQFNAQTGTLTLCAKFHEDYPDIQQVSYLYRTILDFDFDERIAWCAARDRYLGECRAGEEFDTGGDPAVCLRVLLPGNMSFDASCNSDHVVEAGMPETASGREIILTAYEDSFIMYEAAWRYLYRLSFLPFEDRQRMWWYQHAPIVPENRPIADGYEQPEIHDPSPAQWFGPYSDALFLALRKTMHNILHKYQTKKPRFFCWTTDPSHYGINVGDWITFHAKFWDNRYAGTNRRARRRMLGHEIMHYVPSALDDGRKIHDFESVVACGLITRNRCYGNDGAMNLRRLHGSTDPLLNIDSIRAWADNHFARWGGCWPSQVPGDPSWVPPGPRVGYIGQISDVDYPELEPATGRPNPGRPNEPSDGRPNEPSDGRPNEPGDGRPNEPGDGRPNSSGTSRPNNPGGSRPNNPGGSRPNTPGDSRPNTPGTGRPNN